MRTVLVVNPKSGAGRTGRRLEELERLARHIFGDAEVRATTSLGDGRRLGREAAAEGVDLVIAVGGDGTANEVVDGLLSAGGGPAFGLVPAGTGSDLAKTLAAPPHWDLALRAVKDAEPVRVDAIQGVFTGLDGEPVHRYGINVVGVGMAGDVVRRANEGSKRLGGTLTFLKATLGAMLAWRAPVVEIAWEDEHGASSSWRGPLMNAFVCNGSYCGGGMCVAPDASMRDGLFDLVIVPKLPLPQLVAQTPRLYDGTLGTAPGVLAARARRVTATAVDGAWVPCEIDGEQPGVVPVTLTCLAGALELRAPWRRAAAAA